MKSLIVPVLLCPFSIISCGKKGAVVRPTVTPGTAKSLKAYAGNEARTYELLRTT